MTKPSRTFTVPVTGPFDLAREARHFGGWPALPGEPAALVLAFPVDGAAVAAAVVLRQAADGAVSGEVHGGPDALVETARRQALAALSLDVDATGWPEVGLRDPEIGALQTTYGFLRPVLFHSPYEAAASFVLGHRISIAQVRALRARLAEALGTTIEIEGAPFHAFPTPTQVLEADALPGVQPVKAERLRALARAAQDGWLTRDRLRALPVPEALAQLETLPGVGPFFAQGILFRGAGIVDGLSGDDVTRFALSTRYRLAEPVDAATLAAITERWAPFRTWANVLLHVWVRSEVGLPARNPRRR
jgi:DNA-3-methyladenine glycosylase II